MRKIPQPQNPNPTDLRVQRRHKKREGKVERDTARVFYRRLSPVLLKIQFNSSFIQKSSNFIQSLGFLKSYKGPKREKDEVQKLDEVGECGFYRSVGIPISE